MYIRYKKNKILSQFSLTNYLKQYTILRSSIKFKLLLTVKFGGNQMHIAGSDMHCPKHIARYNKKYKIN